MVSDAEGAREALRELRRRRLDELFGNVAKRLRGKRATPLSPRSLGEREKLTILESLGLLRVESGEFRFSQASGHVKRSELNCSLTPLGALAAEMLEAGDGR
jgi:hypothetical protein